MTMVAAPFAAAFFVVFESAGIAVGGGVVGAIGVTVGLLRVGGIEDRVHGGEAPDRGVVFAGTEMGQVGGVDRSADVAVGGGPVGLGAAGVAERVGLAAGHRQRAGVDGE